MKKTGRKLIALLLALALILSDGSILVLAEGAEAQTAEVSAQTEAAEALTSAGTQTVETTEEEAAMTEASVTYQTAVDIAISVAETVETMAEEAGSNAAETVEMTTEEAGSYVAENEETAMAEATAKAAGTEKDAAAEKVTEAETEAATAEGINRMSVNVYDDEEMDALLEIYRSLTAGNANAQASDSVSAERVEELKERLLNSFLSYESTVDLSDGNYTIAEYYAAVYDMTRLEYRIFFVEPVWKGSYTNTGIVESVSVTFRMEEDEVAAAMAELEAVICEIVNAADESWSDMEKVLYLNDYLARNCEYDLTLSDYSAYGALVEHTTVCQGYTMAFYTLAKRMGLTCGAIRSSSLNHVWNYVYMEGSYYCVDVTWDDPTSDLPGRACHTYLLKSCTWFMSDNGGHNADDWMFLGDNADEMSEDSFADTSYDEYFWDDITQEIEYIDGYWYAMNGKELTEYIFNAGDNSFTSVRTMLTISDMWLVWGNPDYYYPSAHPPLASYNGILYYATPTSVYQYNPADDSAAEIYTLSEEETAEGYIYGILVTPDGTLKYCLATSPSGSAVVGLYTLSELDTSERTEIDSCTIEIDDSDLVYNGSLQMPDITITDGSRTLIEGLDYVAASFDNVNVGEKELCIIGIGDYTGTAEESFIILYEAPELTSIYNASNGVVFTFDTVDGVGKYRVYRRESTSDAWESIGYAPSSPCRDENVESGKTYYYALQYYTEDYKTALSALSDTGSQICYLDMPTLNSYVTYSNSLELRWDAVTGAAKYRVYYKLSESADWSVLGDTTSASYVFSDGVSGTYYYFTVCAIDATGQFFSSKSSGGYKHLYLSPVSFSLSITSTGMKIAWSQVTGAGGYYIYRQADGESSATLVKNITSGETLSWTDTSAVSGTTYTYYVNAYYGDYAGAQKSITLKYIGVCSVSYVCNTMDGLKVAWNEVNGADGYYIYRRNDDGTYSDTPTATVTGSTTTSWTDTSTLTGGKDYTYKVAAYYLFISNITLQGGTGKTRTCKYLKGGSVSSVVNTSSGPKVTWTKVAGANGYYVYRCVSGGEYELVATVSGTSVVSWTDTSTLTSGKNYTYKVAPFFKNSSNQVTKGGAKTTKTIKYLTAGKISSLTNTSSGITVKWSKVTGATGYYVYRKASGASSYTLVKTITSVGTVSYSDTAVKSSNNTTYTYYVMPYFKSSSGAITKAGYTTKTTVRLVATSISSLTNSASKKMTVKWSKKSGVTGYQIQYSTSSSFASGNKTVTVTGASSVSKTISSLTKGKTYYVRIRTYKTVNGTTYYSAWSSSKSVKISK